MKLRVDEVPLFLKPLFLILSIFLGSVFFLYFLVCHMTCKINLEFTDQLNKNKNVIFCFWHFNSWSYFIAFFYHKQPHAWLVHPMANMKPVYIMFRLMGVKKIILGSSQHDGRVAMTKVISYLKDGYSTVITPDGPHGPVKKLKKGVLFMSLESKVPIIPITIEASRYMQLWTWDKSRFPLPFTKINVRIHEPFHVTNENFKETEQNLQRKLSL